jgi:hypothetical protein
MKYVTIKLSKAFTIPSEGGCFLNAKSLSSRGEGVEDILLASIFRLNSLAPVMVYADGFGDDP